MSGTVVSAKWLYTIIIILSGVEWGLCKKNLASFYQVQRAHKQTGEVVLFHMWFAILIIADMPWSDTIIEQFEFIDRFTEDETEYYGSYNTLLNHLFPCEDHFQVVPQAKGPLTPGSIEFSIIYIVRKRKCPVFFIDIKPFTDLGMRSIRREADTQMRERFFALIDRNLVIPKLYGVSAMGTRLAVYDYSKETNQLTPRAIASDPKDTTDVAPADCWTHELLEPAGEAKMRELVASIKAMCADIACTLYSSTPFFEDFLI